jgi:hypothetical protein
VWGNQTSTLKTVPHSCRYRQQLDLRNINFSMASLKGCNLTNCSLQCCRCELSPENHVEENLKLRSANKGDPRFSNLPPLPALNGQTSPALAWMAAISWAAT